MYRACSVPHFITPAPRTPSHARLHSIPPFPLLPKPSPDHLLGIAGQYSSPSSRLKLHHPVARQHPSILLPQPPQCANSPLRPLLVQHSVSTLLATDRVSTLERHAAVTVAAQVVDRRSLAGSRVALVAAWDGDRAAGGGGDVCFARGHVVCVCAGCGCVGWVCW